MRGKQVGPGTYGSGLAEEEEEAEAENGHGA
jgi:hypothetical protein